MEDIKVLANSQLKLVIPKPLRKRAVQWYHHYSQHPVHTRLEETLHATMTCWPAMRDMVRRFTKKLVGLAKSTSNIN